ncbi:lantibiotic dehydratase C-terminal domain-containing protein [Amycolatopsis sp. GA6-003]|uniref:lantibiotic dehydratase C-terminal domain-containing protein n=1 Tax=Amycolatopsis sp. GA6-003 TaxID=2652444 RepID=UPI0039175CE4
MTGTEWWFARLYPGTPSGMDAAVAGAGAWARQTARDIDADCWYFIRYVDPTGVHVRLRLRAHPDALDELAERTGPLQEIVSSAAPSAPRLLPEAGTLDLAGPAGIRLGVYEPEVDKYGAGHLPDAERCFQESSELLLDLNAPARPANGARTALAVHLMRRAAAAALPAGEIGGFWAHHRSYWGNALRALRLPKDTLRSRVAAITLELDRAAPPAAELDRISEWSTLLARRISAAGPARRQHLLFHHVHMTLNRLGYLPAEEALLGFVAQAGR